MTPQEAYDAVCSECAFFERVGTSAKGKCKRFPPKVFWTGDDFDHRLPSTDEHSFCGEYMEGVK